MTLRAPAQAMRGPRARPVGHDRADRRARRCEYRTGDDDLRWLALRVAMLGVDFEVHEPPELIEHLQALADRLERAIRAHSEP